MKKSLATLAVLASLFLALPASLMAQGKTIAIIFNSNAPGTTVVVDGVALPGVAPMTVQLKPGLKVIVASAPGFKSVTLRLPLTANGPVNLNLLPGDPGLPITFSSNAPNASLTVDGVAVPGVLPQTVTLTAGTHTVSASAPGYKPSTVALPITQAGPIAITLQPAVETVNVTFTSNAPGAQITVDGELKGVVPVAVSVTKGNHVVTATAPGYKPSTVTLPLTSSSPVAVNLVPDTLSVTFTSNAPGTTILINGAAQAGVLPLTVPLAKGNYTVTANAPGYLSSTVTLPITGAGPVSITLQQETLAITFTSNAPKTTLSINGAPQAGTLPLTVSLTKGTYTVTASAPGYNASTVTLPINGAGPVMITLQPSLATVGLDLSRLTLAKNTKVKVLVNGVETDENAIAGVGTTTIKLVFGPVTFETTVELAAGKSYVLSPFAGIELMGEKKDKRDKKD